MADFNLPPVVEIEFASSVNPIDNKLWSLKNDRMFLCGTRCDPDRAPTNATMLALSENHVSENESIAKT